MRTRRALAVVTLLAAGLGVTSCSAQPGASTSSPSSPVTGALRASVGPPSSTSARPRTVSLAEARALLREAQKELAACLDAHVTDERGDGGDDPCAYLRLTVAADQRAIDSRTPHDRTGDSGANAGVSRVGADVADGG